MPSSSQSASRNMAIGYLFSFLGVIIFSLTPIATKLALQSFSWEQTLILRWIIASIMAWLYLLFRKQRIIFPKKNFSTLLLVMVGLVLGFPLILSYSLQVVPASHAAVFLSGMPLATTLFAVFITKERPHYGFWIASFLGALVVLIYSLTSGPQFGQLHPMDIVLFIGVGCVGIGYAASGKLSQHMGGLEIAVWGIVIFSPIAFLLLIFYFPQFIWNAKLISWIGVFYIGIGSQWLGFFAWNRGLKLAGTSKGSQVTLVQSFLTMFFASFILGETITWSMIIACVCTLTCVVITGKMKVHRNLINL